MMRNIYRELYTVVAIIPYLFRFAQCIWMLVEENENNEWPNELKYLCTMLVIAARTNFEEMDLLAYGFDGCNHFEHRNSVPYLLGHFQGLGSHEPQVEQLQGGAWDDEYENDDDDYAEKWRRRGNDGNRSASRSFGSGS
ncbi:phosphate transporter PHO1 homolog 8-like [Raphanus sativus]|uniref:Phosphate transporter PHO1 homolog 8-like n=1 Tax=Raphanus sativus TaxID=3726 RepID=A0A9W3DIQ6_RAPSA|nr:phosphate transporter PHO1 homolog 8-like [Raphanus sativus]